MYLMSELLINISGAQSYRLELSIYDSSEDGEDDVWLGVFTDTDTGDSYQVFFEANSEGLEAWDVIDMAISTYRETFDEDE
jgi:hypothetical protein